ncbi:MAG: hypothetical protein LBV73_30345, partial [Paraburkholderia sp.]|nr:hypothetical protein [Paraburkholderia sp.]
DAQNSAHSVPIGTAPRKHGRKPRSRCARNEFAAGVVTPGIATPGVATPGVETFGAERKLLRYSSFAGDTFARR